MPDSGLKAWCYVLRECGAIEPDSSGDKYQPKYMIGENKNGNGAVTLVFRLAPLPARRVRQRHRSRGGAGVAACTLC